MIPEFFAVTLITAFIGFQDTVAITHRLEIVYADGEGYILTTDYPNLPSIQVTGVCSYGVWTTYTLPHYSSDGGVQMLGAIQGQCLITLPSNIRSARMVGSQQNNSLPSASFFKGSGFGGEILVIDDKVPHLPFPIMSFVTINIKAVEFFREVNYQGESFCVDIWEDETYWVWEWEELLQIPWEGKLAMSARIGCNRKSSIIVRPQAIHKRVSRNA